MFDGEVSASGSSGGGIDWGNIFGKLVDTGASLIQRNNQPSGGGYGGTFFPTPTPMQSTGINTSTLLLVAGAGLGLYLILRKR